MRTNSNQKVLRLVQLSLLVALVVVLQIVSAIIPPIAGSVSITLTLVPVVIGAILFGIKGGTILGFAFGLIVMINCITGLDLGGNMLWNTNPFFTAIICIVKGAAAGIVPAVLYKLVRGKQDTVSNGKKFVAALTAALAAPIVNTALFVCGMLIFFNAGAGGNAMSYVLMVFAGANFIVEFLVNIILTPAIVRIVDIVKKKLK